jgi:hypothetical protein
MIARSRVEGGGIMNRPGISALAAIALCVLPSTVAADAIDGNWCYTDGRYLTIEGPDIRTPGGTRMQGNYDRHAFAYVVPSGEPGAGEAVTMVLHDEDHMSLQIGGGPAQNWTRCTPPTS